MAVPIVECTLLKSVGKRGRGEIVRYDRVKADGLRKRGFLEIGRVALAEDVFLDTESPEEAPKPRRRRKSLDLAEPEE